MQFPKMFRIRQTFDTQKIDDIAVKIGDDANRATLEYDIIDFEWD